MALQASINPIISKKQPYGPGIGNAGRELRSKGFPESATAFDSLLQRVNALDKAARDDSQSVREILVTDSTGKVIGAIGQFIFQGVPVTNYFSEIHVGDPLGTGDPSQALFNANSDGSVTIGQNGWLDVLDPYDSDAAWIGTQYDTQTVTGAVASATTPLIRLTVTGHTLATGDVVRVLNVGGVPNATGIRTVTKIDANHVDLQSTVFVGTYTSGGTVDRLMHVTGAVNNGSGLIRLTITAHGYESSDKVNVQSVGGVSAATGQWIITVITANTFDLVGSTFVGAYTSGGTSLRYFAGGLFQTIAVGPSFANYKLRAFADGTLRIKNSVIDLSSAAGEIILDPSVPSIVVTSATTTEVSSIDPVNGFMQTDGTTTFQALSGIAVVSNATSFGRFGSGTMEVGRSGTTYASLTADVSGGILAVQTTAGAYMGVIKVSSGHGVLCLDSFSNPCLTKAQLNLDSAATPTDSQVKITANALGAFSVLTYAADNINAGYDVDWIASGWVARHAAVIIQRKNSSKMSFVGSTGNSVGSAATLNNLAALDISNGFWGCGTNISPAYAVDATGDINASVKFRVGGTAGIGATRAFGTSLTVNTSAVGVFGTPGAGQSNGTVVTGVTLNTTSSTWAGGILTV